MSDLLLPAVNSKYALLAAGTGIETRFDVRRTNQCIMIESAKKTRFGARGARKVKTGCQTCKTRRKKCDEARPTCSQCRLAGWRCDFEADDSSMSSAAAMSRAEAQAQPSAALVIVRPPGVIASPPSGIQVERQLLEYFKRVTWMDFAYFFDDLSWERQLLPAITTEPIIYHTGLAISALGWSLAHPSNLWTRGSDPVRSADEYCTMQYNKAVHLFKSRMENPLEDAHALQVLILGSLMFIHLEFMRGLTDFVQVHLRGANALLKSLKQRSRDTAFLEAAVAYVQAQWDEMEMPACYRPPRELPVISNRITPIVGDEIS